MSLRIVARGEHCNKLECCICYNLIVATLSARKISKGTGASRATARKWIEGQALSKSKQCQIDTWAESQGILIASRLLSSIEASRHSEARGLIDRLADHLGCPGVLHEIKGEQYLQSESDVLNALFHNEVRRK